MEKEIQKIVEQVFKTKTFTYEKLYGGMSNQVYCVKVNKEDYVVRIPFDISHYYVDYQVEHLVLNALQGASITNELVYYDENSGIKVSKFIPGITFAHLDHYEQYLPLLVTKLKELHKIKKEAPTYDYEGRLDKYEQHIHLNEIEPLYYELKKWWLNQYKNNYQSDELVFCHGDIQRSNIVLSNEEVFFLDFEFSAYNSIYYDLASFANINFEDALTLAEAYFGSINQEIINKIKFYRMFQVLQWYLVALSKHEFGIGPSLRLDFLLISQKYLKTAANFQKELKK